MFHWPLDPDVIFLVKGSTNTVNDMLGPAFENPHIIHLFHQDDEMSENNQRYRLSLLQRVDEITLESICPRKQNVRKPTLFICSGDPVAYCGKRLHQGICCGKIHLLQQIVGYSSSDKPQKLLHVLVVWNRVSSKIFASLWAFTLNYGLQDTRMQSVAHGFYYGTYTP